MHSSSRSSIRFGSATSLRARAALAVAGLALALSGIAAKAEPQTFFAFSSSPEAYVGAGQSFVFTPETTRFVVTNFGNPGFLDVQMYTDVFAGDNIWEVLITAPWNTPLTVGSHFSQHSIALPESYGLALAGQHRQASDAQAYFDILELTLDSAGEISSFAVNFVEYDESDRAQWNAGQLRFNSDVPLTPVPEPTTQVLLGIGLAAIFWRVRQDTTRLCRALGTNKWVH